MTTTRVAEVSTPPVGTAAHPAAGLEARSGASPDQPPVLATRGLRKAFGGHTVLEGVDLELKQGEFVLLRGENASGKTTLLNILTGHLEPDEGSLTFAANGETRTFEFPRSRWMDLLPAHRFSPEVVARLAVGRTWQDIRVFGALTLRDNLAVAFPDQPGESLMRTLFSPRRTASREESIVRGVDEYVTRLELQGRAEAPAGNLSLGESKRLSICRALAAGARVLLLDEPLAGLDGRGAEQVLELLRDGVMSKRVSVVVVEHVLNQTLLRNLQTSEWVLEPTARTLSRRQTVKASEGSATPSRAPLLPEWLKPFCGIDVAISTEELPRGAKLTHLRPKVRRPSSATPHFAINELIVRRSQRVVIGEDRGAGGTSGVSFSLLPGELAVLQAPNGWGKSTLLAALAGLIPEAGGEVRIGKTSITGLAPWRRHEEGLRALASVRHALPSLTTKEVLRLAGVKNVQDCPFRGHPRRCGDLSGGEKQLLAWTATVGALQGGEVVILDEPFSGLDRKNIDRCLPGLMPRSDQAVLLLLPLRSEPFSPEE